MKATSVDPKTSANEPHSVPAKKASPVRLMILLGVLVAVCGALAYDWVIAPPQVKAAYDKLEATALKRNELGFRPRAAKAGDPKETRETVSIDGGGMIYSEEVQEILGMTPSRTEKKEQYTIEYYRWWGWIPRNQNFIAVLYIGDNPDKRHYSTHFANELPDDVSLQGQIMAIPPVVDSASGNATAKGGTGDESKQNDEPKEASAKEKTEPKKSGAPPVKSDAKEGE